MKCSKKLLEYARKVNKMRNEQNKYFSTRQSKHLIDAKTLEYDVDRDTREIIHKLGGRDAD